MTSTVPSRMPGKNQARIDARERLIVALDFDTFEKAKALVEELDGSVRFFKVGMELHLAAGAATLEYLKSKGKKVFLDLKYFDVPETVERAVRVAAALDVAFLTVHGYRPTIQAAVRGRGSSALKLLAVTVLTSMDSEDVKDMGSQWSVEELVLHRARQALEAGCDGVIASGQEAAKIRQTLGDKLLIVTPGIRPGTFPKQDQKRAVSPQQAVQSGADFLVVGRFITTDADPRAAAETVIGEMQQAFTP